MQALLPGKAVPLRPYSSTFHMKNDQTRIAIFYDGNYLLHVSNYYVYQHARQSRISIRGLHDFIRAKVAQLENRNVQLCPIIDAHYFRGRLSAFEAKEANKLFAERQFDDILMNEGVVTHYLPIRTRRDRRIEKGIDVYMALECYELSLHKEYDVVVLIASDGDFAPLVRKLNTLGVKTMLLSWDLEYNDENGNPRETRTAQDLLEEVTYPVYMHEEIDSRLSTSNTVINNLFLATSERYNRVERPERPERPAPVNKPLIEGPVERSTIFDIKDGYGFITLAPNNVFFHFSDLYDTDPGELRKGDPVEFVLSTNDRGPCARQVRLLHEELPEDEYEYEYDEAEDERSAAREVEA